MNWEIINKQEASNNKQSKSSVQEASNNSQRKTMDGGPSDISKTLKAKGGPRMASFSYSPPAGTGHTGPSAGTGTGHTGLSAAINEAFDGGTTGSTGHTGTDELKQQTLDLIDKILIRANITKSYIKRQDNEGRLFQSIDALKNYIAELSMMHSKRRTY